MSSGKQNDEAQRHRGRHDAHLRGRHRRSGTVFAWGAERGPVAPRGVHLDDERLAAAVALAERIDAEGDPLLRELDRQSLVWRGKPVQPG